MHHRRADERDRRARPSHSHSPNHPLPSPGALAAFLTTPFDVLKTRSQVTDRASQVAGGHAPSAVARTSSPASSVYATRSTMAAMLHIAQSEGIVALFAGVGPRLAKVALHTNWQPRTASLALVRLRPHPHPHPHPS